MNIEEFLKEKIVHSLHNTAPNLSEAIQYSLLAPGKRIRPRLLMACAQTIGLPREASLPVALALEAYHCFTLIHDDLPCLDDDDFRRGLPSCHKKFGEAVALLAGDALYGLSFEWFLDAAPLVSASGFQSGLRRFSQLTGVHGVIGGQAAELLLTEDSPLDALRSVHSLKTGALFLAAATIPLCMSETPLDTAPARALAHFGSTLGIVFQAADDLSDKDPAALSILGHLSGNQIRIEANAALDQASGLLRSAWKEKCEPLIEFSDEVRKLLT